MEYSTSKSLEVAISICIMFKHFDFIIYSFCIIVYIGSGNAILYRYRGINSLLKYCELENREYILNSINKKYNFIIWNLMYN